MFDEIKQYVGFESRDEAALRALHPILAPEFAAISDVFYSRLLEHEGARSALPLKGDPIGRRKTMLVGWLDRLFAGPWDRDYFELRCRIGVAHVRIELPQHYMLCAMHIVNQELGLRLERVYTSQPEALKCARMAVEKILSMDLAIMLHAYRADMMTQNVRAERLPTLGQLVGSISNELRNPLAIIESSLYLLKNRVTGDDAALKHVNRIKEQLNLSSRIVAALADLVRDRPLLRERLKLRRLIEEALGALRVPPGVKVVLDGIDAVPEFHGDSMQLCQALRNLLENTLHAAGASGEVMVQARDRSGTLEITVADGGPGVASELRPRPLEPLLSNKPGGPGLGLPLARRLVEQHGGTILYSPREAGSYFIVTLPIVPSEAAHG